MKNAQPVYEIFSVARAMQPCGGSPFSEITLERSPDEPLRSTLQREQALFLDYALSDTARIKSDAVFSGSLPRTCDTLTLPTRCYAVEFNDRFVTIFSLQ
jgi:hypothetical protein